MADNNKNPRRTIWLSETEPLSHYDIWLSKNQHLNSDGEPLSDSGVLRPCDYIFKVWDCDNWYPIIGFNSTAVNKINTVYNTNYTTTHNGHSISSSSYQEFHLPLFTNPNSSPLELFDAGTIGEAILEYVTELEWYNIFEGDAFSNSFELYFENVVNEGDIDINILLKPAEANKLGGIWADEFSIEDMFPDSEAHDSHSQTEINDSYNWIALAKYKLNHGTSDYNLYVSAKDVIGAINHYQIENPEAPGIDIDIDNLVQELLDIFKNSSSLGFEDVWSVASDPHVYPHIWGVTPSNAGRFLRINPEWNNEGAGWSQSNNNMDWVDLREIIPDLINEGDILVPKDGINISYVLPHGDDIQYVEFGLNHIAEATDGAVCRKITSNGLSDIEWTLLDDIYPLLGPDSSSNIEYVVKGGSDDKHYLNGNGEWAVPTGTEYTNGSFISINQGVIDIAPYSYNGSYYLNSNDGHLSWASAPEQQNYPTLSSSDHSTGPYVINGCNEPSAAKFFLNGNGEWTEISEGIEYTGDNLINVNNTTHKVTIDMTNAENEDVIICDSGVAKWSAMPNPKIGGLSINCNQGDTTLNNYTLFSNTSVQVDNEEETRGAFTLMLWNYYNVSNCKSFTISSIPNVTGPIYIRLIGSTSVSCASNIDIIDIGSILSNLSGNDILITLQFGIAKFEQITTPQSSEPEPEPSEPSEP